VTDKRRARSMGVAPLTKPLLRKGDNVIIDFGDGPATYKVTSKRAGPDNSTVLEVEECL
jgi:hypothetical protein